MFKRYCCALFIYLFLCFGAVNASASGTLRKDFMEDCVANLKASEAVCSCSYDNYTLKEAEAAMAFAQRKYDIRKPQITKVLQNQEKHFEQDDTVDAELVSAVCGRYEELQTYYDSLSKDSIPGQKMPKGMSQKVKIATDEARAEVHNLLHAKGVSSGSYGLLFYEHGHCKVKKELEELEAEYQEAQKAHEVAKAGKTMNLSNTVRHTKILSEGKAAGCKN